MTRSKALPYEVWPSLALLQPYSSRISSRYIMAARLDCNYEAGCYISNAINSASGYLYWLIPTFIARLKASCK